ncbi:hypothetical protein [Streptomyces sp. NPDC004134]|uniref:hypothetical protein n=1 Tax=Streptomyces sp. NPDC004134 TaxID=3364691 RepID=UPI003673CA99
MLVRVRWVLAETPACRECPALYRQVHAWQPPPRELTPAEEERIADKVAHRPEAHVLFPPERADREFREALHRVLRRAAGRRPVPPAPYDETSTE